MSFEESVQRPGGQMSVASGRAPRGRVLITTLAIVGVLLVGFLLFTSFWTDLLWYRSVGESAVFTTQLWVRIGLFVVFGGFMSLMVGVSIWLAYRSRPLLASLNAEQVSLERYRAALDPLRRISFLGIVVIFGILAGVSASSEWQTYLVWRNATPFGISDPQFGLDLSFFVFTLPFLRFVLSFLFGVVVLALIAAALTHYIYGGLRLQTDEGRLSSAARLQLFGLGGFFLLLKAAAYALDRWELATDQSGVVAGLTYTDVNAVLPATTILLVVALGCAVIFFIAAFRDLSRFALTAFGLLLLTSIGIGGLYPAAVQQFQVRPQEGIAEKDYIARNITATRAAYQVDKAQVEIYQAVNEPDAGKLKNSAGTVSAIRLIDPSVVSPTFTNLEQNRTYYSFPDVLDVDRYTLAGARRGATVAVREINIAGIQDAQRNWTNEHITYTHGYGLVASYDNTATTDGKPQFFESGVPTNGLLDLAQPRVYFGENSPAYSIVGGPASGPKLELDYPDESSPDGTVKYTYQGTGGVPVGSAFNRLLFAVKYQDANIVLSDQVNEASRILEVRDPRARVQRVAPWLTLDSDAYPAAVDGRIVWILDGYTTTDMYPSSRATTLGDATSDSLVTSSRSLAASQARGEVNYLRNSVKATVDAYDGTVKLYEWDTQDPILQTWRKAFPDVVTPKDQIPPTLAAHLRYPADLFRVQRKILSQYHVTDANTFFQGTDFWSIPDDPAKRVAQPQPPYYLQVQNPDVQGPPVYSLTTTFAPQKRPTLAAFMAVNSEPGPGYGTIRILQLPGATQVPGPAQVQNNFETDSVVKQQLTLLRGQTGDIDYGNLLSLPAAGGVLYVEPVYIRAGGTAGYPLLRKILVGFGQKVALEDTIEAGIAKVFSTTAPIKPPPTTAPPTAADAAAQLAAALADARAAFAAGLDALARKNLADYAKAQDRLSAALDKAAKAEQLLPGATPSPSPSTQLTSPSPSATQALFSGGDPVWQTS